MKIFECIASCIVFVAFSLTGYSQIPTLDWVKNMGGTDATVNGKSIVTDVTGNVYTTGSFNGTVDFNAGAGIFEMTSIDHDGFVTKTDANGNFEWAIQFGADSYDESSSIAIDTDGNVLVTGYFHGTVDFNPDLGVDELTSLGVYDGFILKLTSAGALVFARQIGGVNADLVTGNEIQTDGFNNIYVIGSFNNVVDFDPDNTGLFELTSNSLRDAFVMKLDKDGIFQWANSYGGSGPDDEDYGESITIDPDGNIIAAGEYGLGDSGYTDIFIKKFDTDGTLIWDQVIGGGSGVNTVHTIRSDAAGNIYYSGTFDGTVDFNPFGSPVELTDGYDSFACKISESGEVIWVKSFGFFYSRSFSALALDNNGNIFLSGFYTASMDVDPGPGVATLHIQDNEVQSPFILKLDNNGDYVWAQSFLSYETEITSITTDNAANIYAIGEFANTTNFSTGICLTAKPTAMGDADLFVLKLKPTSTPTSCFGIIEQPQVSGSVCQGSSMTLIAIGAGTSRVTYQWQEFNGTTFVDIVDQEGSEEDGYNGYDGSKTPFLTIYFSFDSGTEQYRCKVSGESVADTFSNITTITLAPSSKIPYAVANSGCGAGQYMITAYGSTDGSYNWYDASKNSIAGEVNSTFTTPLISTPTTFYVTKGSGGCKSDFVKVQVNTNACAPVPGLVWVAQPQTTSGSADINRIAIDASGNIYAIGTFSGTVDFDTGAGTTTLTSVSATEVFLLKLTRDRNVVWVKSLNNTNSTLTINISLSGGNIYLSGTFRGTVDFDPGTANFPMTSTGNTDMFITKLDTDGNFIWAKRMGGTGTNTVFPRDVASDANGVYVTGSFAGTVDFDPNAGTLNISSAGSTAFSDIFISKLDASGNLGWAFRMGRSSATDGGRDIKVDASGNVYSIGTFFSTVDFDPGTGVTNLTAGGATDFYIHKLNNAGVFQWARVIGSAGVELPYALALDASGNPHVTGTFNQTTDFDPETGVTQLNPSQGITFILKLTASGTLTWAKNYGATFAAEPNDITIDATGNIFTIGYSEGIPAYNPDFDPGSGVYLLNSNVNRDAFVSKLDANGNFTWAYNIGSTGLPYYNNEGKSIATDTDGSIYTAGSIVHSSDLDPGNCTYPVFSTGARTFIQKIKPGVNALCFNLQPIATNVCPGATAAFSAVATGTTNITYQWQKLNTTTSLFENITNAGNYSGTNTSDLVINTNGNFGAGDYRCLVTGDLAPDKFSNTASLTVGSNSPPTTTGSSSCSAGSLVLTASGGTNGQYRWYDVATGGTAIAGEFNNMYTTPSISTTTSYFVSIITDCESARTEVKAIITSAPLAPTTVNGSHCGSGVVTLKASGGAVGQYRWYNAVTSGTAIAGETNDSFTTPSLTATATYYAAINNGSCESNRTAAIATVNTPPAKPNITSTEPIVSGTISVCLTLPTLSAPSGFTSYLWSSGQTTQQITTGAGKYSVTVTDNNGCTSSTSDEIQIISLTSCINSAPIITSEPISTAVESTIDINLLSMISDPDNNLNTSTLKIISQPTSGAVATLSSTGVLKIDYKNISFSGTDHFTIEVCDLLGVCTQKAFTIEVIGEIEIYNGISPNGDDKNEFLRLQYIDIMEATRNNKVSIFNRWGDLVFEIDNYDNKENVFKGLNKNGNEVPSGTYFYKIDFASGLTTRFGYLTVKR